MPQLDILAHLTNIRKDKISQKYGKPAQLCILLYLLTSPTRSVDASTILGFVVLGAATIRVTTLQIHMTKKLLKYFPPF